MESIVGIKPCSQALLPAFQYCTPRNVEKNGEPGNEASYYYWYTNFSIQKVNIICMWRLCGYLQIEVSMVVNMDT